MRPTLNQIINAPFQMSGLVAVHGIGVKASLLNQLTKLRPTTQTGKARALKSFSVQLNNKTMPKRMTDALNQAKRINPLFKLLDSPEGLEFMDTAGSYAGSHKLIKRLFNQAKQKSNTGHMSATLTHNIAGTSPELAEPLKLMKQGITADLNITKRIKTIFNEFRIFKAIK